MDYRIPDIETLKRIASLASLSQDQLIDFANILQVQTARKGEYLIRRGSTDNWSLYVLVGSIELIGIDGHSKVQNISGSDTLKPVAQLRPSIFDVVAKTAVEYIKIKKDHFGQFVRESHDKTDDISVHSVRLGSDEEVHTLIDDVYQFILINENLLPVMPEAAKDITSLYRSGRSDPIRLAGILVNYPPLSRQLFKHSKADVPFEQILDTTRKLGQETIYCLIMSHLSLDFYQSSQEPINLQLERTRAIGIEVASAARAFAKLTKFCNPDLAMTAGLYHSVGTVPVLRYLNLHAEYALVQEEIDFAVSNYRPGLTKLILRRWNFPEAIIEAASSCEDWHRNSDQPKDLCDLLKIAKLYTLINSYQPYGLPDIESIPAIQKFGMSKEIIHKSKELVLQERAKIEKLLRVSC